MENKKVETDDQHEAGGSEGRNLPAAAPSSPTNHGGHKEGHFDNLPMPVPTIVHHGENSPLLESSDSVGEMVTIHGGTKVFFFNNFNFSDFRWNGKRGWRPYCRVKSRWTKMQSLIIDK
jgi:hypothetical protein